MAILTTISIVRIGGIIMKRFLRVLVSLIMVFTITIVPVYADANSKSINSSSIDNANIEDLFPNTVKGQLISDDGQIVNIIGYKQTNIRLLQNNGNNEQEVTYHYTIPMSIFSHSNSVTGSDSTGYMSATVTIYYSENNSYVPSEYLLTQVKGAWSDPNPNDGTIVEKTAHIKANCSGVGHAGLWNKQIKEGKITSGGSLYTGFTNSIITTGGALGAYFSVGLSQGVSRKWTLNLECFAFTPQ